MSATADFDREMAARAELNKHLDPEGRDEDLANQIARLLLEHNDADGAYSALVAASALFLSDPEIDKADAAEVAKDFGEHVAHEVNLGFEAFVTSRQAAYPEGAN
ncbi:hypothetical protein ACHMW4_04185 [Mesorhizobium sp. UC22_110]|uniref:hypothetical protein n=1 Tax=unclassified Mesorhizobium TaxID=325217 RepID=UPI00366D1A1E